MSQAISAPDISLMTGVVKHDYWVTYEPVYNSNLVILLTNGH